MHNQKILDELPQGDAIDSTTGLRGNSAYRRKIIQSLAQGAPFRMMLLGIDNFRHINDLYLYSFGDKVLKHFSEEINNNLPSDMELFRLDGDGFGILYFGTDNNILQKQYEKILSYAQTPKNIDDIMISVTVSAGVCAYPEDGHICDVLYQNAKIALAKAKSGSKKKCVYYSAGLFEKVQQNHILHEKLKWSVENDLQGFSLVYQPIIRLNTNSLDGCEVLLRWSHPDFPKGVSPTVFVPILQEYGLMVAVGTWVIMRGLEQCKKWDAIMPGFQMNINVAASQFKEKTFVPFVIAWVERCELNPQQITLELTESEEIDYEIIGNSFKSLRQYGIKTAFDDFGTGYSSVDIFRTISADELKIDRSFIKNITYNTTDQMVLKGIIAMCKSMNIIVCVEGIEDKVIEKIVAEMNPELLQGYAYSRPISAEEFEREFLSADSLKGGLVVGAKQGALRPIQVLLPLEILNQISAAIFQVRMDENFTVLAYNEGFRKMTGFSADDIRDKFSSSGLSFMHPDDRNRILGELSQQLTETGVATSTYRLLTIAGNYIWVVAVGNLIEGIDDIPSLLITLINIEGLDHLQGP